MKQSRISVVLALAVLVTVVGLLAMAPAESLSAPATEPAAAPAGLTMKARAAFDGTFKYGEWLPIWVELENSGADLEAELQVRLVGGSSTAVYATAASLPTGSHKRIPLYVLPNNYSHELEIGLVKDKQVLLTDRVTVSPRPSLNYFVGLVAPQRGALALLSTITLPGQNRPKELLDLTLADLPERPEGLRSLDCLILNDVDTSSLTPQQKLAIESWVRQGGRLVIGGGAGAMRTASGVPASLLPLVPRDVTEVDELPGMAALAEDQAVRVPGPFVVATGDAGEGVTLAEQDSLPLVRERTVGSGAVDMVALDLTVAPFDAWSGATAFWEALLSPGATYPDTIPPDMSLRQMRNTSISYALSNLPSLDLPSVKNLAVLLAIYILLVGPVNYAILRWRKRLQWAWLTIPVITIAFSGGAFGLAYAQRGSDVILNKIAIMQLLPDGTANLNSYVGLFSPAQQSYQLQVTNGGLLSPVYQDYNPWGPTGVGTPNEMVFVQGEPGTVRGLTVSQWSMQTFAVEGMTANLGRISGEIGIEGDRISGTVRNETPYDLTGVVAILGNQFVRLPDMKAGQEVTMTMSLQPTATGTVGPPVTYRIFEQEMQKAGPNGPSRTAQLRQSMLENVLQPGGWAVDPASQRIAAAGQASPMKRLIIVGWTDQAPPEVSVARRSPAVVATGLVYATLPYNLEGKDRVILPAGLVNGRLAKMPTEGGTCGQPGIPAVYVVRGRAIFEFQLPEELLDVKVDELTISIGTDGGWLQPPSTAIYNWDKGDWTELQNQKIGPNVISGAQNLVSPSGLVQVRLSSQGGSGGCYYVELGLAGERSEGR